MIDAIAWDIDGTLVDSEPLHQDCLMEVARHYGINIDDDPAQFVGISSSDIWRLLQRREPTGLSLEEWSDAIISAYVARVSEVQPFPGAVEAVAGFHAAGFAQCCVSNSSRTIVDANIGALGIAPYLAFSLSLDDVTAAKPHPDPYAIACRKLGRTPSGVLVVEDSPAGVQSGRAAGCTVLIVGTDFTDHADLPAVVGRLNGDRAIDHRART
jgi:HAD superfamily hydrolase (TIGR01509 family)